MKWRIEIRLNFRRPIGLGFRKIKVGFRFEWAAWLIAYDVFDVGPDDFNKLSVDDQFNALAFGAAAWDCTQTGKRMFFNHKDIKIALDKASKEENRKIGETIKEAQFPEWLKKLVPDSKKKVKSG